MRDAAISELLNTGLITKRLPANAPMTIAMVLSETFSLRKIAEKISVKNGDILLSIVASERIR